MTTDADKLPEELKQFLEARKAAGLTEQEAIATAIDLLRKRQIELLRRRPEISAFDVAARGGFIGAAGAGLPADLSTNPAHMEGFGRDSL